jgi:hypothetical protein
MLISGKMLGIARASSGLPAPGFPREARCAQKTVTFHLEFSAEILENARYVMHTLYQMEHLQLANEALGQSK